MITAAYIRTGRQEGAPLPIPGPDTVAPRIWDADEDANLTPGVAGFAGDVGPPIRPSANGIDTRRVPSSREGSYR
jgi:hypothetical protein